MKKSIASGKVHHDHQLMLDYFAVSLPDLLIFDSDLNVMNEIHYLYIHALGYLSLDNYPVAAA